MALGARITDLRLRKGQSLQQVADAVGVSKAHIWELEKGKSENPSMLLVQRLAEHFGVSMGSLVGEDVNAADADPELVGIFRLASRLEPHERAILSDMMKSLLKRRREEQK